MMNKTLIMGIVLAALRADAGMPDSPPNVVAKTCVAVVIAQATNRGDVVQYDVVETIRGLTPTNPLPFGRSSPLSCLKQGDRAFVFLEIESTSNRQSTISGVELKVRKIAMIRDGKVHYLGPRPGEPSTGKQVHDFDLDEFLEMVKQPGSDRDSTPLAEAFSGFPVDIRDRMNNKLAEQKMIKILIVMCVAAALVGCNRTTPHGTSATRQVNGQTFVGIGVVGGADTNAQARVMQVFKEHGIDGYVGDGSVVYGIWVVSNRADEATRLLVRDSRRQRYWLKMEK